MAGIDAFGIQFERGDGTTPTEAFAAIGNVYDVKGPDMKRDTYDVTAHDSVSGWREFVGGLKDAGEVTISVNYDPSKHDTLVADFEDTKPRNYKMVFPGGLGEWALSLILSEFSADAPVDNKLSADLKFKVSGKPTITAGS